MKDEIKEILYELNDMFQLSELEQQVKDIEKILDYITNLQNQLEEKTYLYNKLDTESKYVITNLQEEKDKFKLRCYKALRLIRDNYGVLDKYVIDTLDDILNGGDDNER